MMKAVVSVVILILASMLTLCSTVLLVDPCDPTPCDNMGICEPTGYDTASCRCAAGFTGAFCHEVTKQVRERMVCNVTDCEARGQNNWCVTLRCMDNAADCGGIACKKNEECYNGRCEDEDSVCNKETDGVFNYCVDKGERCGGDDSFCLGYSKCLNDTCWRIIGCDKKTDGESCWYGRGTCKGGACLQPCGTDRECDFYSQCIGGYCRDYYCGKSYCRED